MSFSPEESASWIATRQSIYPKNFDSNSVISNEEIYQLLEVAQWAPTHKLTQPWRFHVFNSDNAKDQFLEFQESAMRQNINDEARLKFQIEKLNFKVEQSGAIIGIVLNRDLEQRIPEWEETCAVACAVQNVAIHAKSLGLGGYWSTGSYTNHELSRAFLKLGNLDVHLGWFFLGRISKWPNKKRDRLSVESFTKFL